jgi:hypothetical protein
MRVVSGAEAIILPVATYGRDRVQAAKTRMQPLVTALVERAQRDGKLRADLRPTAVLNGPRRRLVLEAAEQHVSLNRLVSDRLARA